MSNFAGLDVALKALSVSQQAIEVTGHNIANANTTGYTRQRLMTVSIEPATGIERFAANALSRIGGGVAVKSVDQIRNPFLDGQYRQETSLGSEWSTRADGLGYVESLFNEMSNTGLTEAMTQFSASLQELAKSPAASENRTNVLQNAISLTETLQHYSNQLFEKQAELDQTVSVVTGQINTIAQSIADLNSQIAQYELNGQQANDLRDQRNNQLDSLAVLTNFTSIENNKGQLQIRLGDQLLVDHETVRQLTNEKTVANPLNGEANALYSVIWADNGTDVTINSGSLRGTLDFRDGATQNDVGMPYLSQQLDRLTVGLADSFNQIHQAGWTLPDLNNGETSVTGIAFFTTELDEFGVAKPMTAANIRVNPAIENNLGLIAASNQQITSNAMAGNNKNALALIDIFSRDDLPGIGSFSGFINGFISTIAVEANQANNRTANQKVLTDSLDQQRLSITGVSLDEEMTNLVKYQHSYAAAARLITTIDEMLDTLINRTAV